MVRARSLDPKGSTARAPGPRREGRRPDWLKAARSAPGNLARWPPLLGLLVYAGLAVVAYLPTLPFDNSHVPATKLNDSISVAWFLDWVAMALRHGHDPLFSGYLEHPVGVNLAVNQSMSLAGLLGAPLTWLLGPFAVLNLWLRLAFVASAASMYLVLRRYVDRELPAFLGGLLYGFSPFVVGHNLISPDFSFLAVPPLLFLVVDDLLRAARRSARRDGLALGLLVAVQLYLNPELLADCVVAFLLAAVLVLLGWRTRRRARLARVATALAWAAPVAGLLGAPFAWAYFAGPQHLSGPVVPLHYLAVFRTDLAGLVVPSRNELLGPARLLALGTSYTGYAINESGVYLGVPLLVLLGFLVVRLRRDRLVVLAALLAAVALVLSLGRGLVVDNHHTGVALPWALLARLPVLQSAEPIRFVALSYLGVSVVLAVGLDRLAGRVERLVGTGRGEARRRRRASAAVLGVALVALVPLVPRWPYASRPTAIPSYFTSGADRALPAGAVAMTYPYAQPGQVGPEMWQMASGFRFRLVGGYAYVADNGGVPFGSPPVRPPTLAELLVDAATGAGPLPRPGPATDAAIRSGLSAMGVDAFLFQPVGARPSLVLAELTSALGRAPVASGGILAWYHVRRDLADVPTLSAARAGGRSR